MFAVRPWIGKLSIGPMAGVDSLPTYPFERQSYWLPSPQAGTSWQQPIPPSANPLLGRRLPTATPIFETVVKPDTPLYLSEHQICGATLVAASVYFEMAQACARESSANPRGQSGLCYPRATRPLRRGALGSDPSSIRRWQRRGIFKLQPRR